MNLRDPANALQQEAIGILGVNLIFAAFYQLQTMESFLEGLSEDVVRERIEVDFVDFRGPAFSGWDHQTLLAHLVHAGYAEAVWFPAKGETGPPSESSTRDLSCSRRDTSAMSTPLMRKFMAK